MASWLGQYCINVPDLDRSVAWYEALGLECTSRTEIPDAWEAIVENPAGGSQLQLAQQKDEPFELGDALWKLYVNTHDMAATYAAAREAGCRAVSEPERMERWPVTVAFVNDPDGHLVEFVQRHPWGDDVPDRGTWMGQYCLNVTDLDATVAFYEVLGLTCTSRTDIQVAQEAIVEHPGRGSKLQLAEHRGPDRERTGPDELTMGSMWKLYVHTDDCEGLHASAVAAGYTSQVPPLRLDRWPVTIAFLADPDGYRVKLVQRHAD